jgi:hypothetical protein
VTKTIDELYAFIVLDTNDDSEGIPTYMAMPGLASPMIGADKDRVASLRDLAQQVATDYQQPVTMVRFSTRELIETIEPGEKPPEDPAPEERAEVVEFEAPGPPRTEEDGSVHGWADATEPLVATDIDVDVHDGGVMVFSLLIDGKTTVCFQFMRGDEDDDHPPMKAVGLQNPHAERVGPLAMAAWAAGERMLRLQQN